MQKWEHMDDKQNAMSDNQEKRGYGLGVRANGRSGRARGKFSVMVWTCCETREQSFRGNGLWESNTIARDSRGTSNKVNWKADGCMIRWGGILQEGSIWTAKKTQIPLPWPDPERVFPQGIHHCYPSMDDGTNTLPELLLHLLCLSGLTTFLICHIIMHCKAELSP